MARSRMRGSSIPVERPPDLDPAIPFPPMEAELVRELPQGDEWQYEPKWDGFRGLLENGTGELPALVAQRTAAAPLLPGARSAQQASSRGLGAGRRDRDRARRRSRLRLDADPASSRRIAGPEALGGDPRAVHRVDVLVWKGDEIWSLPLAKRRAKLVRSAKKFELSPATCDLEQALDWLERFESIGLDGVIAKRLDLPYLPGSREGVDESEA